MPRDSPGAAAAEVNDLSDVVTWANVPDANITESSVTQHEAALTITESQISDLDHSGFTLHFDANKAIFPDSNPATVFARNNHPIIVFDDTTAESIVFNDTIPNSYDGEDINIDIDWVAKTATTGGVTWGVQFERNAPGGNDIDSDSFDTQQTGNNDTNATSGIITRTTIILTQAEADDVVANDSFRLKVQRVTSDGDDDMTEDAQIVKLSMRA